MAWKRICERGAVAPGAMKQFAVEGGPPILLVNAAGELLAFQADCPHERVKLEDGVHDNSVLTCLEHLWQFDLRTGAPLGDAEKGLQGYRVKEDGDAVHVWIGPDS